MKKSCSICGRDLTGRDDAVYSTKTGAYFCAVGDWDECADRADENQARKDDA